jgi:hypothetical protein
MKTLISADYVPLNQWNLIIWIENVCGMRISRNLDIKVMMKLET